MATYSLRMKKIAQTFVFTAGFAALASTAYAQEFTPLTISSGETTHEFQVELADEPDERSQGLMFREELAADKGMLFTYPAVQPTAVWMKNTMISLDLLFLADDGKVLAIAKNAVPYSLREIDPGFNVKGFLEVQGGLTDKLGIKTGDVVRHVALGNTTD